MSRDTREYTPALTIGALTTKPPKQYPTGRRCDTCNTRLNKYNPDNTCHPCHRNTKIRHNEK